MPLGIHRSVADQLQQYRTFYKQETGDDISMSVMLEEIARKFMAEDKAFQRFVSASK